MGVSERAERCSSSRFPKNDGSERETRIATGLCERMKSGLRFWNSNPQFGVGHEPLPCCVEGPPGRAHVYQAAADIFSLTTRRQFFQTPRKSPRGSTDRHTSPLGLLDNHRKRGCNNRPERIYQCHRQLCLARASPLPKIASVPRVSRSRCQSHRKR
jgi:hypothetical protein